VGGLLVSARHKSIASETRHTTATAWEVTLYHEERNHQGKENLILFPLKREGARDRKAAVRCRERLGGLLKYYEREAA